MTGCFKRAIVILAVLGGFGLGPGAVGLKAAAQDAEPGSPVPAAAGNAVPASAEKQYTGDRISLDFQNAELHNLIRILGEVANKSIVISDAVGSGGKVTLKLKDVPWDQALDIILSSQGLAVDDGGDVLTVYPLPVLEEILRGRAEVEKSGLDINGLPPLKKQVFTVKYAPVGVVHAELTKYKSGRGKIAAVGNDIYVEDEPAAIASMTQVFMRVDRVSRQILIEARIVEASPAFAEKFGFRRIDAHASGLETQVADGAVQATSAEAAPAPNFAEDGQLEVILLNKVLSKADVMLLNAAISASETSSEARTTSAPRIMAANDQEVSIKQSNYVGCGMRMRGSSSNTAANLPNNIVMELKVRPHIEESGDVVALDISLVNDSPQSGQSDFYLGEIKTTVKAKDGETIVVGGLITGGEASDEGLIRGGHVVSLMEWLEPGRRVNGQKSELLIFIKANIIPLNI